MARPKKAQVEYFPHFVNHKKTISILESQYKNDGYAFWFKLLELLGGTDHHYIDCNDYHNWMFLLSKTLVNEDIAKPILDLLADLGAIDKELWSCKIIRSQNFIDNLGSVYARRDVNVYSKDDLVKLLQLKIPLKEISDNINPQSRGSKGKEVEEVGIDVLKKKKIQNERKAIRVKISKKIKELTGKNYKPESKEMIRFTNGRLNEGATLENFYHVIDIKKYWIGNPDMDQYYRPSTLFNSEKFWGYTNERIIDKKQTKSTKYKDIGETVK